MQLDEEVIGDAQVSYSDEELISIPLCSLDKGENSKKLEPTKYSFYRTKPLKTALKDLTSNKKLNFPILNELRLNTTHSGIISGELTDVTDESPTVPDETDETDEHETKLRKVTVNTSDDGEQIITIDSHLIDHIPISDLTTYIKVLQALKRAACKVMCFHWC